MVNLQNTLNCFSLVKARKETFRNNTFRKKYENYLDTNDVKMDRRTVASGPRTKKSIAVKTNPGRTPKLH